MVDLQLALNLRIDTLASTLTEVLNEVHIAITTTGIQKIVEQKEEEQGLCETKLASLKKDISTILKRLEKLSIPLGVYVHSLILLKRSVKKYLYKEADTCSRTKLKYLLISSIYISCKMLLEDEQRPASSFASIFRYETARILRNEKVILIDLLEFDVNVTKEEFEGEIKEYWMHNEGNIGLVF